MKPDVFDALPAVSSPRARRPRPKFGRDTLDLYLDRAGRYPRLTAEQERAQLVRLVELRRFRWQALLSQPATHPSVLRAVEETIDELPEALMEQARSSRQALVDDPCTDAREAFERSNAALAVALEVLDLDGQLAERLADDPPTDGLDDEASAEYRRYTRQSVATYHRARNRFVCSNLRLVLKVADRYSGRWMPLVDRVQEGNLGLIKAVERFDPERGTRFSTYAVWWIRHAITRALINRGRTIRIPANLHVIFTKIRRVRPVLEGRLGRPATVAELAGEIDVPVERVEAAIEALELRSVSLDGPTDDGADAAWPEVLGVPAPQSMVDDGFDQRRAEVLARRAMEHLEPRERDILERRFALEGRSRMTLEALGRCHQVSRERVRQLQNRALRTLRHEVESNPASGLAFA